MFNVMVWRCWNAKPVHGVMVKLLTLSYLTQIHYLDLNTYFSRSQYTVQGGAKVTLNSMFATDRPYVRQFIFFSHTNAPGEIQSVSVEGCHWAFQIVCTFNYRAGKVNLTYCHFCDTLYLILMVGMKQCDVYVELFQCSASSAVGVWQCRRLNVGRSWDRASWYISIVKPTRCTIFDYIEYHSTCFGRSFRPLTGV